MPGRNGYANHSAIEVHSLSIQRGVKGIFTELGQVQTPYFSCVEPN